MKVFWFIIAILALAGALLVGLDMLRFAMRKRRAESPKSGHTDAGGDIFIEGRKTYYMMPNGVRRKIADTPLDLRPGSPDMIRFTDLMERARREHEKDKAEKMAEAAKEIAKDA